MAVDGLCDSPGHNATYCTVTAMDCCTNKVLDFNIVHVGEVKNSNNMEKEGNFVFVFTAASFIISVKCMYFNFNIGFIVCQSRFYCK